MVVNIRESPPRPPTSKTMGLNYFKEAFPFWYFSTALKVKEQLELLIIEQKDKMEAKDRLV